MLVEFFLELIRGGPELWTELLHLTRNSLRYFLGMFKALQFLRFWVYRKILLDIFLVFIRGGGEQNSQQNCWIKKKKSLRNFLGMFKVLYFLRFWVYRKILLEFCLELIRGGPELSTELLHLTKNSLWNFLGMFKALQFLRFWVYQKILLDFFVELIQGGNRTLNRTVGFEKKNLFEIFLVCSKYCSFLDFEFIEKCY